MCLVLSCSATCCGVVRAGRVRHGVKRFRTLRCFAALRCAVRPATVLLGVMQRGAVQRNAQRAHGAS
eukprot:2687223-Alexandrium_andersonii.AAC.1